MDGHHGPRSEQNPAYRPTRYHPFVYNVAVGVVGTFEAAASDPRADVYWCDMMWTERYGRILHAA